MNDYFRGSRCYLSSAEIRRMQLKQRAEWLASLRRSRPGRRHGICR